MIENKNTQKNDKKQKEKPVYLDYKIFPGKIRLVREDGSVEIIERDSAIEEAKSLGMNVLQVGYNKNEFPHPICKIVNYGKFLYDQKKREKERAKKSREANSEAKEVYFSIRIEEGDLNTKVSHIREFLEDGSKVKVCVKLLRREMNLTDFAKNTMKQVLSRVEDIAEMDSMPSFTGNIISCTLRPKKGLSST